MRLDEAFSDSGFFWLPEDTDRSFEVPGTLSVSETGRVTLETFGYRDGDPLSLANNDAYFSDSKLTRIFGYTPELGNVTLAGVVLARSSTPFRTDGWVFNRSAFVANLLLTGGHFSEGEPRFDRMACSIEGLHEWLGLSGFTVERHSSDSTRCTVKYHETTQPLPFQVSDDVDGEFGLGHGFSFQAPSAVNPPVASYIAFVKLSTSMSWDVEDVLRRAFCMRNFISLGTGKPTAITRLEGWKSTGKQEDATADRLNDSVKIFCGSNQQSSKSNTNLLPPFMAFTHKDINSHSIKRWFDLCLDGRSDGGQCVELFCDVLYDDGTLPMDIQFFKVAESIAKLDTLDGHKERDVTWRKIKRQVLKFSELLGVDADGVDTFAKQVADTRHAWVHRIPPEKKPHAREGSDLYRLLKRCEALLFYCLTAHVLGSEDAATGILRDAKPIKDRVRSA